MQLVLPLRDRRHGREGVSLVEVAVLALLLLLAIGGLSGAVLSSLRLTRTTEESTLADEAARTLAARMQNPAVQAFRDLFKLYNANPADDVGLAGPIPGPAFDVRALAPGSDDPDGPGGGIVFPAVDLGGGVQILREDVVDERLGMPEGRDLNGNGDPNEDVTSDYVLLPVRLIVEWTGAGGDRSYELDLVLVQ